MIFNLFLMRENGALLPKWQRATHHGIKGELSLIERQDGGLNRVSRVAELHEIGAGGVIETVAPLYDAQLVRVSKSLVILSGIERVHDPILIRDFDYAQTWWLEHDHD